MRIEAKPGKAAAMQAALLQLQQATEPEPGCREFQFFQALRAPDSFLLIEDFADRGALERHMELPHTQAFFKEDLTASILPIEKAWMS